MRHLPFTPQSGLFTYIGKKHQLENIVENGENVGNQHFLLFPQCFLCLPEQVSIFQPHLHCLLMGEKPTFENIVGERENAGNQHFLFFQWFPSY